MTITILWWHFPTFLTVLWLIALFWRTDGNSWDQLVKTVAVMLGAIPVLLVWVAALFWMTP